MKWVTRKNPHVDRCASAWLIKRFIDKDAIFGFISKEDPIPKGAIGFTLPGADIKPVEGASTTYDTLLKRYGIHDPIAIKVGRLIHDFEVTAGEDPARVELLETLGLCYVLKGLEKSSKTDHETIEKAFVVLDALAASVDELHPVK